VTAEFSIAGKLTAKIPDFKPHAKKFAIAAVVMDRITDFLLMENPSPTICYEDLVSAYSNNLEVQTRGFTAGFSWMESWVPDDELLPSLANLVEAAQIGGMDAIGVEFDPKTLGSESPASIAQKLSHLSSISYSNGGGKVRLQFGQLNESSKFSDVRDFYKSALRDRSAHLNFTQPPPRGAVSFENTDGVLWLLQPDGKSGVESAGFQPFTEAPPSLVSAMDLLCEILIGLPLLEIREHALVRLEHRLRDPAKTPPVQGIVLPQNADPIFARVKNLLSGLLAKTGISAVKETNFFDRGTSAHWKSLTAEERESACQKAVDAASLSLLGYEHGIRVIDARKSYAVTIKFEGDAPVAAKRRAALEIEKILRKNCDARVEVFSLEMKDASQLRRL
jgi:hypothetical protein